MIKAILIDDELNAREVLRELLKLLLPKINVVGEAANVNEAYALILDQKPDVIFLDIQMPGGNGFSLLTKFKELSFEVIFVTSYDQYAINAIRFSALDYLLKPIEVTDLLEAVRKAEIRIKNKNKQTEQIANLLESLDHTVTPKIAVHINDVVKLLSLTEILCIEAQGRYTQITDSKGKQYILAKYLKDFEMYLNENSFLLRIHKSCIVNINYILEYTKSDPCIITMDFGKKFEIARRKKQEILEKLNQKK